jgi:hypothetical protein
MCLLSSSAIPTSLMVTSCSNNSSRTYHFDDIDAIRKFSEKSAVITTSKSFDDGFEAANFLTLNVDFDFLGIMLAREYIS